MRRLIRRVFLLFVVFLCLGGVFNWHVYQDKLELRENALLYFHEEDYSKTIGYLQDSLKKSCVFGKRLDTDMTCYMAESYYQLKEYDQAIKIYDELIKDEPKKAGFYILKGECYQDDKDYTKAIQVYDEGWNATGNTIFLEKICEIHLEREDYEQALAYAKKGSSMEDKREADFLFEEIVIYEKSQDYASAYEAACRYCSKYPDDERGKKEKIFLSTRV